MNLLECCNCTGTCPLVGCEHASLRSLRHSDTSSLTVILQATTSVATVSASAVSQTVLTAWTAQRLFSAAANYCSLLIMLLTGTLPRPALNARLLCSERVHVARVAPPVSMRPAAAASAQPIAPPGEAAYSTGCVSVPTVLIVHGDRRNVCDPNTVCRCTAGSLRCRPTNAAGDRCCGI
jgi:hypothetical protein